MIFIENGLYIECDITQRCNLGCKCCDRFCDINSNNISTDMVLDDIQNICNQLKSFTINRFRLIGGEPTLNHDIFKICNFLLTQKNIINIDIISNFIQTDVIKKLMKLFPTILIHNFDGNTSYKIKTKKYIKHINIKLSPFELKMKTNVVQCENSNYTIDTGAGIHIFKLNNILYFMNFAICSAVIRMLNRYDLLYKSIDDLIKNTNNDVFNIICKHCMWNTETPILYWKNHNISNVFKYGLNKISTNE